MIWHVYMIEAPAFGRYREFDVAVAFEALDGAAVVPYEVERIRKRSAGIGMRKIPLLPGYVFVGFAKAHPWRKIEDIHHILGPVEDPATGLPGTMTRRDLAALMNIKSGQDRVAAVAKGIGKGDRVRLLDQIAEVRRVLDGKAYIPIKMLGSEREIAVAVDKLERV